MPQKRTLSSSDDDVYHVGSCKFICPRAWLNASDMTEVITSARVTDDAEWVSEMYLRIIL